MTRDAALPEAPSMAVTGVAVLTPLADTLEGLGAALRAGQRAIPAPVELARAQEAELGARPDPRAATIVDFDAARYAAVRGMRVYNRTTQLAICAVKRALDAARLDTAGAAGERVGLVMAATFGHMDTLISYDRSLVTQGLARTNPALMPLALGSAPGAATALAFNAKAFSVTLSNGSAGALDALGLSGRLLAAERADASVVVAAFSPCAELSMAAARAGLLARDQLKVFDRERQGLVFGEAAVALVLERPESCRARGVAPLGFVRGQAATFAARPELCAVRLRRACQEALRASQLAPGELALVSSGGNGSLDGDRAEAQALAGLFEASATLPVTAVKASLGEAFDASGLLQVALALEALQVGTAPAIAGLSQPEVAGLRYLLEPARLEGRHALVSAASHAGACAALLLSAP